MKKLLSLFLALLILICTFSACAGNAAKPETPSSAASSDSTRPVRRHGSHKAGFSD